MTASDPRTRSLPHEVDVAVVGAGIGGLAAAVALRRIGLDAHVFERATVLREIGGAVVVREPVVHLFADWGLDDGFHAQSVRVDHIEKRASDGTVEAILPADFTGEGLAYSAHRADVHSLLLAEIPENRVHLGAGVADVRNDPDQGVIRLDHGQEVAARLVIGADGIRSATRRVVVDDEPSFAGLTVLRTLASASALGSGVSTDRMTMWGDGALMMVILPLRSGTQIALDTAITADTPPEDLWTGEVPMSMLLEAFAGFDPHLLALIRAATSPVSTHPVYERDPIATWSSGRVTLLGDAAHPMAPRQGQGANQAVLDASALANALSQHGLDDLDNALVTYEERRVGAASALQIASRTAPDVEPSAH